MSQLMTEQVTHVHHWNDTLFSFRTTRDPAFRFRNGHFTMLGLGDSDRPLLRAYSIASANHEDELEFFSIKVPDGPLTSKLQTLRTGDPIVLSRKPTGTLLIDHLLPGRTLWLLATGTGLAPFLAIIKDPETYAAFEHVVLVHGVRQRSELAYADMICNELPGHEYLGPTVRQQLQYFPTVTREPFRNRGRLTDLIASGDLFRHTGRPQPTLADDRFMLCGSPSLLRDLTTLLEARGFRETRGGEPGHYVIERAFVER